METFVPCPRVCCWRWLITPLLGFIKAVLSLAVGRQLGLLLGTIIETIIWNGLCAMI
ncbi:hypothetical protein ASPFODRAFT_53072 [Aspergillus luchuensis CBS 106.47]|uniref:Uncharacterized protein n=1 Tax=Aspergillus luchuensis (strain CBS 106.47) TaxID=1137211 RepID=A0A1M3T179_ASPLC|nr:hypothetical protein ASPFODRAFT_53072 [Aspergillus luchuensis CBS 106.47]